MEVDICVIGCGSGGLGAAITAAKLGKTVAIIDRMPSPGGHSIFAFVSDWPAGPAETVAKELYEEMSTNPKYKDHIRIAKRYSNEDTKHDSLGLWFDDPNGTYDQTLSKYGVSKDDQRIVVFDPSYMTQVMEDQLKKLGVHCYFNTTLLDVSTTVDAKGDDANTTINYVQGIDNQGNLIEISAQVFIDSSANLALGRLASCDVAIGEDSQAMYNEPNAPEEPKMILNGISYCYRVTLDGKGEDKSFCCTDFARSGNSAFITGIMNGDIIINPLGNSVLDGSSYVPATEAEIISSGEVLSKCHWSRLKPLFATGLGFPNLHLEDYKFDSFAVLPGIRETYRLVGEYVLREQDLTSGYKEQKHDDMIALVEHPIDIHGGPYGNENEQDGENLDFPTVKPYGVPYRCLIPKNTTNLLVACRGASFSHIAASSCRLSRTMMGLGHAAALGASMAIARANGNQVNVRNVNTEKLVSKMQEAYGTTW